MNLLRREEHTLLTGKYSSKASTTAIRRTETPVMPIRSIVDLCSSRRSHNTTPISGFPLMNSLQLINDGFETNYAFHDEHARRDIHSSTQTHRLRRISALWKTSNLGQLVPSCKISSNFQPKTCPGSKSKFSMRLADDEVKRPRFLTNVREEEHFHRLSQRLAGHDPSKLQEKDPMYHNKEILAFFEDDFISFACQKDNNVFQNNFMARVMAKIASKLS